MDLKNLSSEELDRIAQGIGIRVDQLRAMAASKTSSLLLGFLRDDDDRDGHDNTSSFGPMSAGSFA